MGEEGGGKKHEYKASFYIYTMLLGSQWLLSLAGCKVAVSSEQSTPSRLTGFWWQQCPMKELVWEDLLQKGCCCQDLEILLGPVGLEGQGQQHPIVRSTVHLDGGFHFEIEKWLESSPLCQQ